VNSPRTKRNLTCPCGQYIHAETEEALVEMALAHLREMHPDRADDYGRDEILFMAY
jgi:hypothetical protein